MAKRKLTVYKSNKIIEAGYKLSLNEQRLVLSCVSKVASSKPLLASDRFEVSAKEFALQFGISQDKAYQTLKEVSEQLFERYVIIDDPDPLDKALKYTKTRWVSSIHYYADIGKVGLVFAPFMIPYLSELRGRFTFYLLENISKMNSIYAIRLYELLMQWKTTGQREVEIAWLKQQFQIEDKYSSIKDFKKYVIEPAIKDINAHSDYQVSWTQRKTGRNVTHLMFTFSEKQAAAIPVPKPKQEKVLGVSKSTIEKRARPGESWEEAAKRIKTEDSQARRIKAEKHQL